MLIINKTWKSWKIMFFKIFLARIYLSRSQLQQRAPKRYIYQVLDQDLQVPVDKCINKWIRYLSGTLIHLSTREQLQRPQICYIYQSPGRIRLPGRDKPINNKCGCTGLQLGLITLTWLVRFQHPLPGQEVLNEMSSS